MKTVTVLGGTGVFGSQIAYALARHPEVALRVSGRNALSGQRSARTLGADFRACDLRDRETIRAAISGSDLVIHAAGPFQGQDYRVAETCLECGSHYLDLSDGRDFVTGIRALNAAARERRLFVASGASSVPAISHAMIRALARDFASIDEIIIALSPGNQSPRGRSTIAAILSYLGRPVRIWQDGQWIDRRGWGDPRSFDFPQPVGRRRVYTCEVPDLDLFPALWSARTVRFYAGLELDAINYSLSAIGWLRRVFRMETLTCFSPLFLKLSGLLIPLGSPCGAMAVSLKGAGQHASTLERRIAVAATRDGAAIPCAPAIVLAKRILDLGPPCCGAFPCMGFVTLEDLMAHLEPLGIKCLRGDCRGWRPYRQDTSSRHHASLISAPM